MSLQGKVLNRLCHSLWRISGNNSRVDLPGGLTSCWLQRWLSSLPQHPLPHSSRPTSIFLPCSYTKKSGDNIDHCKEPKETKTSIQAGSKYQGAGHVVDICSLVSSLSLQPRNVSKGVSVEREWNLASWPHRGHMEYVCPSEKLSTLPQLVILEHLPHPTPYDLPHTPNLVSLIIDPTSSPVEISEPTATNTNVPIEARQIMKIRRKKMKRHLLKKFRKRLAFTLRKIKRDRRKKKEAVFQARLAKIKDSGESFSARDWVQEHLEKARKGGFYINVLEKRE